MAIFAWYRLYEGMWRYVSVHDMLAIVKAADDQRAGHGGRSPRGSFGRTFPGRSFFLDWLLCIALVGGIRLARALSSGSRAGHTARKGRRVLIVGAGDAGEMLFREIERNRCA